MGSAATSPTYLAVGHVCIDELPGRPERLGGTVFFSAGQAAAMGCAVTVVTTCTDPTAERARSEMGATIRLEAIRSDVDTRFEFGADADAGPRRLASRAPVLDRLDVAAEIVHLAPVFAELSDRLVADARRAAFVGATPQGMLRGVDEAGRLTFVADHWPADPGFADAIVLNEDEYRHLGAVGLLDRFDGLVFRTLGPGGAAVLRRGRELARHEPVPATDPVPPQRTIGAGDVFAAAAFVALATGAEPDRAVAAAVESATAYVRRTGDAVAFVDGRVAPAG